MLPAVTVNLGGVTITLTPPTEEQWASYCAAHGMPKAALGLAGWIALISKILEMIGGLFGGITGAPEPPTPMPMNPAVKR